MGKEDRSVKNKRSNAYKPYDTSNSFVRRVFSRVSQFLPQPTSWISGILSSEKSISESVENDFIQPPSKRVKTVHTSTDTQSDIDLTSLRNHTSKVGKSRNDDISPIRNAPSTSYIDNAVAGPSGLSNIHQRDNYSSSSRESDVLTRNIRFNGSNHVSKLAGGRREVDSAAVASHRCHSTEPFASTPFLSSATPCISINPKKKLNGGDCSTDSDSYSSQAEKHPAPFHYLDMSHHSRNNLSRSKQFNLNLSSSSLSSTGRLSFDTVVFNSPFKGRLSSVVNSASSCGSQASDNSSFYRGNTTFGGASACSDSLLRTRMLHSDTPVVVKPVDPVLTTQSTNLATSTNKILKALEQFSTPVIEAKKVPLREGELKRKAPAPYKELVIPQIPDLLRIKRRDSRKTRKIAPAQEASRSSTKIESFEKHAPRLIVTPDQVDMSKGKTFSPSKPTRLKKEPDPVLISSPSQAVNFSSLKSLKPPRTERTTKEVRVPPIQSQYKFSNPTYVSNTPQSVEAIPFNKKFPDPLNPRRFESPKETPKQQNSSSQSPLLRNSPNYSFEFKPSPVSKSPLLPFDDSGKKSLNTSPSISIKKDIKVSSTKFQESNDIKISPPKAKVITSSSNEISVAKTPDSSTKPVSSQVSVSPSLAEKFKMGSDQWECDTCLVRNKKQDSSCIACGVAKEKPKDTKPLVPQTLDSPSKQKEDVVNSSLKSTSDEVKKISKDNSLMEMFKKPPGSWECDSCLVQNKGESDSCIACTTPRPSSKPAATTGPSLGANSGNETVPKFSFGVNIPVTSSGEDTKKFSFGINPVSSEQQTAKFSFGVPQVSKADAVPSGSSTEATTTLSQPVFSFGIPKTDKISPKEESVKEVIADNKKDEVLEAPKVNATTESLEKSAVESPPSSAFNLECSPMSQGSPPPTTTTFLFGGYKPPSDADNTIFKKASPSPTASASAVQTPALNPMFTFGSTASPLSLLKTSEPVKADQLAVPNPVQTIFNSVQQKNSSKEGSNQLSSSFFGKSETNPSNIFSSGTSGSNTKKGKLFEFSFGNAPPKNKDVFQADTVMGGATETGIQKSDWSSDDMKVASNQAQPSLFKTSNPPPASFSFAPSQNSVGFGNEPPPKKEQTPFSFDAPVVNHTNNFPTPAFGAQNTSAMTTAASGSLFPSSTTNFGTSSSHQLQPAPFTFGTPQASEKPPAFKFSTEPSKTLGLNNASSTFQFGATHNTSSTNIPTFDPNVKPVFNFSSGSPLPNFSAQPKDTPDVEDETKNRIIRKAVRRTTTQK